MITKESLITLGYQPFTHHKGEYCVTAYQRCVRTSDGTKLYFINLYEWVFPDTRAQWAAEVELYPKSTGSAWATLSLHGAEAINDVEAFYANAYEALFCVPDIHNN